MEYVKNIYAHTYITIMTFHITRLTPAAYCKSILCFIIILYFYMILYDACILLCHIYEKNNMGTARVGHLHNPYCIRIIRLTRGHPSSRCRFSFELTEIFRIMQLFQWNYTI